MNRYARSLLKGSALLAAAAFGPSIAATTARTVTLKRREKQAEIKELSDGCRYPDLPARDPRGRSMTDLMERLRAVPFKPRPLGGLTSTMIFSTPDQIPMLAACTKRGSGKLYPYPRPFEKVLIRSTDGTPISGVLAVHDDGRPRPALIMVHGLFGSKNHWFSQQVVLSAYYGWGYNVMAIDLRFFGESKLYSDAPGTGGWKEGQDIIEAAKYLKRMKEVTSVAVMGGSYGGAAAMCAAYQSEPKDLLDGGIISWCGYGDTTAQVKYISTAPKPRDPFFPVYLFFIGCYKLTLGGRSRAYGNFDRFIREYCASYYGVNGDDILERSSAALHFHEVEVPMLIVNTEDDPVIPREQASVMEEYARGNENIAVMRMSRGGHCAFATVDRVWMSHVVRTFFNYWASNGLEIPGSPSRGARCLEGAIGRE